MLAGIIAMALMYGNQTGQMTFDYTKLLELSMSSNAELWLFGAFALAFAIKVPLFPAPLRFIFARNLDPLDGDQFDTFDFSLSTSF